jgi:hypothetical protein
MGEMDFEVEIRSAGGRDFEVAVINSPVGEARSTMRFPYDELALKVRLQALELALIRSGGTRRNCQARRKRLSGTLAATSSTR